MGLTEFERDIVESAIEGLEDDIVFRLTNSLHPKQRAAVELSYTTGEVLYGGAAGGGKSRALVVYAISEMLRVPGNAGIIFRRVLQSLKRTILIECNRVLNEFDIPHGWNGNDLIFTFANGSTLELGGLQHEKDVTKYQGAAFGFIGFEEATEFTESQILYFMSRLRAPVEGARPRMFLTANPGGTGHFFIKARYVSPPKVVCPVRVEPFKSWTPIPAEGEGQGLDRAYCPSLLEDNPTLMDNDPGYLDRLNSIKDRGVRLAMRSGDWDALTVKEGALMKPHWIVIQRPPELSHVVVAIDPSGTDGRDEIGIVAAGLGYDGNYYFLEDWSGHMRPRQWAKQAWALYHMLEADAVAVEVNFGGAMATHALEIEEPDLASVVHTVNSSRGKRIRAEPFGVLADPGEDLNDDGEGGQRLFFAKELPELAGQWTSWLPGEPSPDRLDASVFCLAWLKEQSGGGASHGLNWLS